MSNRRDRINKAFDKPESQAPDSSLMAVDSIMFSGSNLELDTQRHVVKPVSISHIFPDPTQPRRAMPSEILKFWRGTQGDIDKVFVAWLEKVQERNTDFVLDHFLQPPDDVEADESGEAKKIANPVEQAFLELISLAVSIRRDGLTNPITVAKSGDSHYQIETGERRWLAFHLLHLYFDGGAGRPDERKKWDKIPARIVEQSSVWRQATENTARQDLNAIGRARQFALLLMDLYGMDKFHAFAEYNHERDFYAQVADGEAWRIPRGKGEVLLNAMGMNSVRHAGYYRQLLSLPYEAWQTVDDYNLTENAVRECRSAAGNDEALLINLVYQAAQNLGNLDDTGTTVLVSPQPDSSDVENPNIPTPSQKPPTPPRAVLPKVENPVLNSADKRKISQGLRFMSRVGRSDLSQMDESQQKEMLDFAKHLERIAKDIKDALKGS